MDAFRTLSMVGGLGLLAGIRLYLTVLCLGVAIRLGWLELAPEYRQLSFLGDNLVLATAGVCFAAEFLADKIPWVDSAWDSIHTFIRPIAAAFLAWSAAGNESNTMQVAAALVGGTFAFSSHSAKAATRLAVNHSPEPFSNMALSLAGDAIVPAAVWFTLSHPEWMIGFSTVFVIVVMLIWPRLYRLMRLQAKALASWIRSWGSRAEPDGEAIPSALAARVRQELGAEAPERGLRVAYTAPERSLKQSIGYLCQGDEKLVFVTRRWGRIRALTIPVTDELRISVKRRMLLDDLCVGNRQSQHEFDVFKESSLAARNLSTRLNPVPQAVVPDWGCLQG